jgi:dihydroceramide fatty acyl 2-hydroxylase
MAKPYTSIRLFENPTLEKFAHVNPIMPALVWIPINLFILYRCVYVHQMSASTIMSYGALGIFLWTLTEYLLHRFVFHFEGKSKLSKRLAYIAHGIHHDDPEDPTRLVMPPFGAMILATPIFLFFRLIFGTPWVEPLFFFFLIGYLAYDYTHYAVHHIPPRTFIGRYLKKQHMLHHFVTQNARYGVSTPLWDIIFGTLGKGVVPATDSSASTSQTSR